jgi:hypothetical protein
MNPAQEVQIQRLRMGSFNLLDGNKVADDLLANQTLWDSFVFGRFEYQPLIELRDLRHGYINADTVFLMTQRDRLKDLLGLIEQWKADEVGWQSEEIRGGDFVCKSDFDVLGAFLGRDDFLIRVWWD